MNKTTAPEQNQPVEQIPVNSSVNLLDGVAESLIDIVSGLESRLQPILKSDYPTEETDEKACEIVCPLVTELNGISKKLNGQISRLNNLVDRLEL